MVLFQRPRARSGPSAVWSAIAVPSEPRTLAGRIGAGRLALGVGITAAPTAAAGAFGVDRATARRVSWLARMMGVRDAVLGAGTIAAARRGGDVRSWLLAGAAADAVDAAVLLGAARRRQLPVLVPGGVAVGALGLAALALDAARRLDD